MLTYLTVIALLLQKLLSDEPAKAVSQSQATHPIAAQTSSQSVSANFDVMFDIFRYAQKIIADNQLQGKLDPNFVLLNFYNIYPDPVTKKPFRKFIFNIPPGATDKNLYFGLIDALMDNNTINLVKYVRSQKLPTIMNNLGVNENAYLFENPGILIQKQRMISPPTIIPQAHSNSPNPTSKTPEPPLSTNTSSPASQNTNQTSIVQGANPTSSSKSPSTPQADSAISSPNTDRQNAPSSLAQENKATLSVTDPSVSTSTNSTSGKNGDEKPDYHPGSLPDSPSLPTSNTPTNVSHTSPLNMPTNNNSTFSSQSSNLTELGKSLAEHNNSTKAENSTEAIAPLMPAPNTALASESASAKQSANQNERNEDKNASAEHEPVNTHQTSIVLPVINPGPTATDNKSKPLEKVETKLSLSVQPSKENLFISQAQANSQSQPSDQNVSITNSAITELQNGSNKKNTTLEINIAPPLKLPPEIVLKESLVLNKPNSTLSSLPPFNLQDPAKALPLSSQASYPQIEVPANSTHPPNNTATETVGKEDLSSLGSSSKEPEKSPVIEVKQVLLKSEFKEAKINHELDKIEKAIIKNEEKIELAELRKNSDVLPTTNPQTPPSSITNEKQVSNSQNLISSNSSDAQQILSVSSSNLIANATASANSTTSNSNETAIVKTQAHEQSTTSNALNIVEIVDNGHNAKNAFDGALNKIASEINKLEIKESASASTSEKKSTEVTTSVSATNKSSTESDSLSSLDDDEFFRRIFLKYGRGDTHEAPKEPLPETTRLSSNSTSSPNPVTPGNNTTSQPMEHPKDFEPPVPSSNLTQANNSNSSNVPPFPNGKEFNADFAGGNRNQTNSSTNESTAQANSQLEINNPPEFLNTSNTSLSSKQSTLTIQSNVSVNLTNSTSNSTNGTNLGNSSDSEVKQASDANKQSSVALPLPLNQTTNGTAVALETKSPSPPKTIVSIIDVTSIPINNKQQNQINDQLNKIQDQVVSLSVKEASQANITASSDNKKASQVSLESGKNNSLKVDSNLNIIEQSNQKTADGSPKPPPSLADILAELKKDMMELSVKNTKVTNKDPVPTTKPTSTTADSLSAPSAQANSKSVTVIPSTTTNSRPAAAGDIPTIKPIIAPRNFMNSQIVGPIIKNTEYFVGSTIGSQVSDPRTIDIVRNMARSDSKLANQLSSLLKDPTDSVMVIPESAGGLIQTKFYPVNRTSRDFAYTKLIGYADFVNQKEVKESKRLQQAIANKDYNSLINSVVY